MTDTIVALATPNGESALSLIRVSGEKVLEIGTGSGYQASILCLLGARVFTIERHKNLSFHAK